MSGENKTEIQRFFGDLTWKTLEKKISDALKDPHASVPLETPCPAIYDLARQIFSVNINSALSSPGQDLSVRELLNCDQRLAVMRILEAILSAYEDWKQGDPKVESPITSDFVSQLRNSPKTIRGIIDPPRS